MYKDTGFSGQTSLLAYKYLAKVQASFHIIYRIPVWIGPQGNPIALVQIKPGGDEVENYQLRERRRENQEGTTQKQGSSVRLVAYNNMKYVKNLQQAHLKR